MFSSWFRSAKPSESTPSAPVHHDPSKPTNTATNKRLQLTVLVIQEDAYDWKLIMKEAIHHEQSSNNDDAATLQKLFTEYDINVVQSSWKSIEVGPIDNYQRVQYPSSSFVRCPVTVLREHINGQPVTDKSREGDNDDSGLTSNGRRSNRPRVIFPDFVLIRNEFTTAAENHRNKLLGLIYADVPSVNSLRSILLTADKPVVQGALHRLRSVLPLVVGDRLTAARRVEKASTSTSDEATAIAKSEDVESPKKGQQEEGSSNSVVCQDVAVGLPLISQSFFSSTNTFFYGQSFPAVVKFGSAHAGYGKVCVKHHHDMDDLRTLLPLTKDGYCTAEPFVDSDGDLRLQRLGKGNYRAFHRRSTCGAWKTNTQSAIMHEIVCTETMKEWLEACSTLFGSEAENRMEILTIDVVVAKDPAQSAETEEEELARLSKEIEAQMNQAEAECNGTAKSKKRRVDPLPPGPPLERLTILEMNGTSSGLSPDTEAEDNLHIATLVLKGLAERVLVGC